MRNYLNIHLGVLNMGFLLDNLDHNHRVYSIWDKKQLVYAHPLLLVIPSYMLV